MNTESKGAHKNSVPSNCTTAITNVGAADNIHELTLYQDLLMTTKRALKESTAKLALKLHVQSTCIIISFENTTVDYTGHQHGK